MAIQTTYPDQIVPAFEGQIANSELCNLVSRTAEADIGFARVVKRGANDGTVSAVDSALDDVFGITVRDQSIEPRGVNEVLAGDTVLVLTVGTMWVTASSDVAAGEAVHVVPATGAFTNDPTDNLQVPNAEFDTSGSAGSLVRIRVS